MRRERRIANSHARSPGLVLEMLDHLRSGISETRMAAAGILFAAGLLDHQASASAPGVTAWSEFTVSDFCRKRAANSEMDPAVREAARAALNALEAPSTLLRASSRPTEKDAATLLRPAQGVGPGDTGTLLRPVETAPAASAPRKGIVLRLLGSRTKSDED